MIFFTPVYEVIMKGFEGLETVIRHSIWGKDVKGGKRRSPLSPHPLHSTESSPSGISSLYLRSMNRLAAALLPISSRPVAQVKYRTIMSTSSHAGPGPSSLRNLKPPSRLGMQELDRSAFKLDLPILSIKVKASDIDRYRSNPIFRT
jgi:hypothetical protein